MQTQPRQNDNAFLYAPDSAFWQVNRELAILLAGPRMLLMQVAHPMVAASVYHHSYVFQKPLLRLYRTLSLTMTLIYGTQAEIHHAVAEIERVHRPASGKLSESTGKHKQGAAYNPRNPRQAMWVYATLIEGALDAYERFVSPLSTERQEAYYQDSLIFAETMHIPRRYLPDSYAGLLDYMQQAVACEEVHVGPWARKIAPFLTLQASRLGRYPAYPLFRLTVNTLPESIRAQYGYARYAWEQPLLNFNLRCIRLLLPLLPAVLRFQPHYRRAQQIVQESQR